MVILNLYFVGRWGVLCLKIRGIFFGWLCIMNSWCCGCIGIIGLIWCGWRWICIWVYFVVDWCFIIFGCCEWKVCWLVLRRWWYMLVFLMIICECVSLCGLCFCSVWWEGLVCFMFRLMIRCLRRCVIFMCSGCCVVGCGKILIFWVLSSCFIYVNLVMEWVILLVSIWLSCCWLSVFSRSWVLFFGSFLLRLMMWGWFLFWWLIGSLLVVIWWIWVCLRWWCFFELFLGSRVEF